MPSYHAYESAKGHKQLVHFELNDPTARRVCIAGSFNDWHPDVSEMVSMGSGKWGKDLEHLRIPLRCGWQMGHRPAMSAHGAKCIRRDEFVACRFPSTNNPAIDDNEIYANGIGAIIAESNREEK